MTESKAELAERAWRNMSALILNRNRKAAVTEVLGISFARTRVLRRLVDHPLTLRELAERLSADPPYVTLMIDDLEDRGLVRRKPHPTDRRAKLVELTPSGRKIAARANAILDEPIAALRDLPEADLRALMRALDRLAAGDQPPQR
jgi:DNA-binding MarR family transcriptional regulator